MNWDYRIIHHDNEKSAYFAMHEVFYDEKGVITFWTADPVDVSGETEEEILDTLRMMASDTKREILLESELEKNIEDISTYHESIGTILQPKIDATKRIRKNSVKL